MTLDVYRNIYAIPGPLRGAFAKRNEGGTVRWYLAPTTAPAPERLLSPQGEGGCECGGRERAHYACSGAAVQAAAFPDVRQASTVGGCCRSGPPEAVGKNCHPTGVAAEQASNTARGTPRLSAESRQHYTTLQDREVLRHAGSVRLGGQRGPAFRAPPYSGAPAKGRRRTRRRKEYGRFCLAV